MNVFISASGESECKMFEQIYIVYLLLVGGFINDLSMGISPELSTIKMIFCSSN